MDNFYDDTDGGENGAYANTTLEDSNARILNDVQHPATSSQQDGYNGSYNWGFDANNPIGPPIASLTLTLPNKPANKAKATTQKQPISNPAQTCNAVSTHAASATAAVKASLSIPNTVSVCFSIRLWKQRS